MAIRVVRNDAGNCVNFVGSTNPTYWNACLSAEIDPEYPDRINIKNDIRTAQTGEEIYEFFRLPYMDFAKADGTAFVDATEAAEYITEAANVLGLTTGVTFGANDYVNFKQDPTQTTVLVDNGDYFPVNAMKAVANDDGTINIMENSDDGTVLYTSVHHDNITINNGESPGTLVDQIVNSLNALFTNNPVGAGGTDGVITFPLSEASAVTANTAGTQDPVGTPIYSNDSDGGTMGHYWTSETIDERGEYFLIKMTGWARSGAKFMLGFRDTSVDLEADLQTPSTNVSVGMRWGNAFYKYSDYIAPWTIYGNGNRGFSYGPGWSFGSNDQMLRYATAEQTAFENGAPVLFKCGIDENGFWYVSYYNSDRDEFIMCSRTSYVLPDGEYGLVVKLYDTVGQIYENATRVAVDPSGTELTYRYIESPDGSFHYPLFSSEEEANAYDTSAGGSGSSHTHVYVDEPTNSSWYMPDTNGQMAVTTSPLTASASITWNEIATNDDALYAPAQLTLNDQEWVENTAINLQIVPQDTVATVTGLPDGLNYNLGFIQGTTPYVPEDTDYVVTVERSNGYGTTTQTFTITVTNNPALGDIAGFTELYGNTVQPNRVILTHDAVLQYDTVLSQGQELTYSYGSGEIPPTIGILSTDGQARFDDFAASAHTLGSGNHDFAETSKWDLRYVTFGGDIGAGSTKFSLVGWQNNTVQSGSEGTNHDADFKLSYELDTVHGSNYHLVLYRNGVEVLRSNDHYSGDQTITFAAFDDQQQTDVYVPSNLTIANIGAGSTTPPTGFEDPLLAGEMDSTTLLGDTDDTGAAVQLTTTLEMNHRYIIPQTWIEANVLPNIAGAGANAQNDEQFYFGVAKSTADWASIDENDFHACFRVEGTNGGNLSRLFRTGTSTNTVNINSATDAYYDYALEWDGTDLHVIACNIGDINTQPAVSNGGSFSRVLTYSTFSGQGDAGQSLTLAMAVKNGGAVNLTTAGLQQIRIPFGIRDDIVGESSGGNGNFSPLQPAASKYDEHDGGHAPSDFTYTAPTVNAGQTYRFLYHASMEAGDYIEFRRADDNTVYTTGVTTFGSGDPAFTGAYKGVEFAIPSDAPPLKAFFYNAFTSSFDAGRDLPISGSTYVVDVSGITQEGPGANQTDSNLFDAGDYGWISIDEQLGAGERLVLSTAFLADLIDAMPVDSEVKIGLKDTGWAATTADTNFEGALRFVINKSSTAVTFRTWQGNSSTSFISTTVAGVTSDNIAAFFDLTNSGNNIRFGIRSDATNSADDASSTAYGDWNSSYKVQTGDQGYGLTAVDVMILGRDQSSGGTGSMDTADVVWTALSEISVPTPAATLTTPWTKALDFAGGSERTLQVTNDGNRVPLRMSGVNNNAAAPATAGNTSNDTNARPWATSIVFKAHTYNDNQHVWNMGEGAGTTDDNIYLRRDANRNLWFGWGRSGSELNECYVGSIAGNIGGWWGVYIASNGTRLGSGHTAAEIAAAFDIRMVNLQTGAAGSNLSTATNWTSGSFGARMNRQFTGDMTIGGRGANRSFRGKVAAMVVTTLRRNVAMPTDAEISMMVRDPQQWMTDYKVGNAFRLPWQGTDAGFNWSKNDGSSSYATQVWLMGDGANDAYSQIRNNVWPATQNYTPMNMISMVSNDIETVNIPGLT